MPRIDIAVCGETRGQAVLEQFVLALHEAGFATRLSPFRETRAAGLVWQSQDDVQARARLIVSGGHEVVGPWMERCESLARALRFATRPTGDGAAHGARIELGELAIDLVQREARRCGQALGLLGRELDLLIAFAQSPGSVFSRMQLLQRVWRMSFDPGTNVVEVHMSRLRSKLDRRFDWPMLRTVRGAGYMLDAENKIAGRSDLVSA